jgi:transketolase
MLSIHTVKPLDEEAIRAAARETGGIVTVEENVIAGGLGGAVAEVCLEAAVRPRRFLRLGIRDAYTSVVGDQAYLRRMVGIDAKSIVDAVAGLIEGGSE